MKTRVFKSKVFLLIMACLVLSLIVGCGGGGGGGGGGGSTPPPSTGSVTGYLKVSSIILPVSASIMTQSDSTEENFVPGEIIVRFKDGTNVNTAMALLLNKYKNVGLTDAGYMYLKNTYLLRTNAYQNNNLSATDAKKQTQDVILELKTELNIQYAEPNGIVKPQMIPNNPLYFIQWDMSMIDMPMAWELTQGSSSIIVAVLDSGIRSHPNLDPNVLSTGYNFVDMNSDPTEPLSPNAEFHGTHVAGTIAAIGNTGKGMAGVAWNVKIMPVRVVCGPLGSSETNVIQGMLYAAGLPNSSGTVPPQRANVINISLAGKGSCDSTYQNAINQVIASGVSVVVAAGNNYPNGNPVMTPASCQGVIAVGALDPFGYKASYSESQPYVFIAAPGGEESEGVHAGILSTLPSSSSGGPYYKFMQGTSMATPHVSGVIALMLSVNPNLTPPQIMNILSATATPPPTFVRNNDIGYGLIDAGKAVAAAEGVPIPAVPVPYPWPSLFNFQQISVPMQSTIAKIFNKGGSILSLLDATPTDIYNSAGQIAKATGLSVNLDLSCFSIAPSGNCSITYIVDPTGLPNDEYYGFIVVFSNGGNFIVPIVFQVGTTPTPSIPEPITVQLWSIAPSGELIGPIATTTTDASQNYQYTFQSVPAGNYVVVAGVDKNGDGSFWRLSR